MSRPPRKSIVRANLPLVEELERAGKILDLLGDLERDAAETCWGCGIRSDYELREMFGSYVPREVSVKMDRAHIVARRHDGSDEPTNFFLLCGICHHEQPDAASPQAQVKWLKARQGYLARATERHGAWIEALSKRAQEAGVTEQMREVMWSKPFQDSVDGAATLRIRLEEELEKLIEAKK